MITEEDQKKYRIAIGGFRSQRKLSHIKISKLEQKKRKIDKEIEKVEKGLAKNKEMEEDLLEEMRNVGKLPF